jgi:hypothetical protein
MAAITSSAAHHETAMISVQLMSPTPLGHAPNHSAAAFGSPPADEPAKVTAHFRPLDSGIVNEAIPAFFIGRNGEGFWVARDAKGRIGGIFLLKNSALSFARESSRPAGCATIFLSERFELDLENHGNPLVAYLAGSARLAKRLWPRTAALIARMTKMVKRRSDDLHVL